MKFLIWSLRGDALGVADKLASEGNDVRLYIHDPHHRDQYTGILRKVKTPSEGLSSDTIILFDMVGEGGTADRLKAAGHKVIGGGKFNDRIELDRRAGFDLMERSGIDVGKSHEFPNLRAALGFARETEERLVLKPLDNQSTLFTYVPPDPDHLVMYLNHVIEQRLMPLDTEVILQEYFDGIEISTEVWLSKGRLVPGLVNHTIEGKKFMNEDKGPTMGSATSVVWRTSIDTPMVEGLFTGSLLRTLEREGYTGPIDINSIVRVDTVMPYGLEFTARLGYSAVYAFAELLQEDLGSMLSSVASGGRSKPLGGGFGYAVRVSVPPYPFEHPDDKLKRDVFKQLEGLPIGVMPDSEHIWLLDAKRNKQLEFVVAGVDGVVMEVTSSGESIEEARDSVNEILAELTLPDAQYRTDGADRAIKIKADFDKVDFHT